MRQSYAAPPSAKRMRSATLESFAARFPLRHVPRQPSELSYLDEAPLPPPNASSSHSRNEHHNATLNVPNATSPDSLIRHIGSLKSQLQQTLHGAFN